MAALIPTRRGYVLVNDDGKQVSRCAELPEVAERMDLRGWKWWAREASGKNQYSNVRLAERTVWGLKANMWVQSWRRRKINGNGNPNSEGAYKRGSKDSYTWAMSARNMYVRNVNEIARLNPENRRNEAWKRWADSVRSNIGKRARLRHERYST